MMGKPSKWKLYAQACRRLGLWVPRGYLRDQKRFAEARAKGAEALRAVAAEIDASIVTCLGCGWVSGFYNRNQNRFLAQPTRCDECGRRNGAVQPDEAPGEYVLSFPDEELIAC